MTDKKTKKPAAKATDKEPSATTTAEIYCVVASALTSKGRAHHGDNIEVPAAEAADLIKKGYFK